MHGSQSRFLLHLPCCAAIHCRWAASLHALTATRTHVTHRRGMLVVVVACCVVEVALLSACSAPLPYTLPE